MKLKEFIKTLARPVYFFSIQLWNMVTEKPRAKGFIFMLHRVADWEDDKIVWNENMKVSPAKLDQILTELKQKYDVIRLEEVPKRLAGNIKKKFVCFTMDDGYKDNYTNALPIFQKHNIPYTIFLATDFMDKKAILWWYEIEDLIQKNDTIVLSNGLSLNTKSKAEKADAFLKIREIILKQDQLHLYDSLNQLFNAYDIDWFAKSRELALSWDEVQKLKQEKLVTLGAHTKHHYNLKALPDVSDVIDEVEYGYKILENKADLHPVVFAYPFGSINEADKREFKALSSMSDKFELAVRACGGPVTNLSTDYFALPRIMLTEDYTYLTLLRYKKICVI